MKKRKVITIGIGFLLLVALAAGIKIFNPFYKKVTEEPLDTPAWKNSQISNNNYVSFKDEYDIVKDTASLGGAQSKYYSKYIEYVAPNGKPIRIVAMHEVSDDQMLYAYDLLSFYLKNTDAVDKSAIANKMADNNSVLILPNGADRDGKTPMAAMALGQNLNQQEIANIGSAWYMENDFEHRDASFEEIFHMVHDYGIGTSENPQASQEISKVIADAKINALPAAKSDWGLKGLWGLNSKPWLEELANEGSLEQEYIVSVIDSYYGLWEAWTEESGGMWGTYVAKTRAEIIEKDPKGLIALESFLPKNINQMMRVDSTFKGTFDMNRNDDKPYTYKSQYLQNVYLSGSNDSNLIANNLDNILMGNSGKNTIDGGAGHDVLQLRGPLRGYNIDVKEGHLIVTDSISGRDGVVKALNIEVVRAIDADYLVER